MAVSQERLDILAKIGEYERNGWFDRDVENDPPTRPLEAGECDYLMKKRSTYLASELANLAAKTYFDGLIRRGELVISGVEGIENYRAVQDRGVILTCNHFHPCDHYAVYKALEPHLGRRRLYKVIREGNYTSFPGLYGYFFRHCNTLPLGSSMAVWREFMEAVSVLLQRGEKILIYPEQAMWWNYRKPRPLKGGAFRFAVKEGAPVLPIFITLEDTDKKDADGLPIQAYTLHFLPAIFPDAALPPRKRAETMAAENYALWREVYERVYGETLRYAVEDGGGACSM